MSKSGFVARVAPAIAILAVVAGASAPAMARTTEEKLARMAAAPTDKAHKAPVRYCFVDVDPATRAEQRDCRTRATWIRDEGIDPSW